jgi:hypothetical protein
LPPGSQPSDVADPEAGDGWRFGRPAKNHAAHPMTSSTTIRMIHAHLGRFRTSAGGVWMHSTRQ